jgi:deoxyribonucleoside regulator
LEKQSLQSVAKLYYEENQTQSDISKRLGISRPKVSRMLSEARKLGIVKIFIDAGADDALELEGKFHSRFNLKAVKVVSVPDDDKALASQLTVSAAARFFASFLSNRDKIGVAWGWTLNELVKNFPELNLSDSEIFQLTGGVDNANTRSFASEIVKGFSAKLNAKNAYALPCPALVGSPAIAEALRLDPKISYLLSNLSLCNKIFVNIAVPDESSCLYQSGYLTGDDVVSLKNKNAAGSVCSRFFDENGEICDAEMDARTIGISLDDIKKAEYSMSCIVAPRKARAVYRALESGLINALVIDSVTAELILEL